MDKWRTRVTEILGTEYPIIQGAFHGFGTSQLAAAVSEAGGLGMITAHALRSPQGLREDIRRLKARTDKPFAVNITLSMCENMEEIIDVIIGEEVPVVETAIYKADVYGSRLQEAGVTWIHKVATVKHALAAERQGVDAVTIIGLEGTGFKNPMQLPSLIGIPWAVRQLRIPIIAGGGIADSYGFMAAMAMGAEAVYMGTAFMATQECPIPDRYKQTLAAADPTHPNYRDRNLAPVATEDYERAMGKKGAIPNNEWLVEVEKAMIKEPVDEETTDTIMKGQDIEAILRFAPGSLAVAVIDSVPSVKELIDSIIAGAERIRQRWSCLP